MPANVRNSLLDAAGEDLVRSLGGRWQDGRGMCPCPVHADTTPSLSVRVGDRSLLFKCFAGCDTLDVLRAIRRLELRVPIDRTGPISPAGGETVMRPRALALWKEALPITRDPASRYLLSRGITIGSDALRFHPRTPIGQGRAVRFRPAIIAAVAEGCHLVGIQRIFLAADGSGLARDLATPRLGLGRPLRGAVQLMPAGPLLGLAEGVETAMAAAMLLDMPVWAALGGERLHQVIIPPQVRRLVLLPDKDQAGRLALSRALDAYDGHAFAVKHLWPWGGLNDWNDVLRRPDVREGRRGWGGCDEQPDGQAASHPENDHDPTDH